MRAFKLWVFFLIAGTFFSTALSSEEAADIPYSEVSKWKTISGEARDSSEAEKFLRQILNIPHVTALSVAVVQGSQVVFQQTLGILDEKTKKPVNEQTVFRTASLSKPVFAFLVMKLVDEGLLDVDRPLYQYLKRPLHEYPDYTDLKGDARYKLLTARILLSHQSGFPNWRRSSRPRRLDFKFDPGTMFKYSGEGYKLMQFILEEMTEKNLSSLAKEKVFHPQGMTTSSFLWERRFDNNFSVDSSAGLRRFLEKTKTIPNAAYSLLTNTTDYAQFLLGIMNGGDLSSETLAMMLEPQVKITSDSLHAPQGTDPKIHETIHLAWSMGWGRFRCPQGDVIFHVGFEEGCDNYAVVFLDRKIGIIIQSTLTGNKSVTPLIVKELIGDIYSPLSWLHY